jgi:hypothetical protein
MPTLLRRAAAWVWPPAPKFVPDRPADRFEIFPGIPRPMPNDDVAAAIDVLAAQVPRDCRVDLLVLSSDTTRATLHGRGRSIDITRQPGRGDCDVRVHSFPSGSVGHVGHENHVVTDHPDVALEQLGALFAQPAPGEHHLRFIPRGE